MAKKTHHYRLLVFRYVRLIIIISLIINIATFLYSIFFSDMAVEIVIENELSIRIELIFLSLITYILTYSTDYIEKHRKIDIPDILEIIIVLFIYAGIYLSAQFNLYYKFFWWDDLLHTLAGIVISFTGFLLIYKLNYKYSLDLNPLLIAVFTFSFAVTMGVIWEILEFTADWVLGSAHQKWDLPATAVLMGRDYQGSGLRDTMSDLILTCIGAFVTSYISYYMYKYRRGETLKKLNNMIKEELNS
ncbi:MAG: hypothetical protein ACOCRZ_05695 [Halothermotrichaceae bacterium]